MKLFNGKTRTHLIIEDVRVPHSRKGQSFNCCANGIESRVATTWKTWKTRNLKNCQSQGDLNFCKKKPGKLRENECDMVANKNAFHPIFSL